MWAAKVNLVPGQLISSNDLEIRRVRFETQSHSYLSAEQSITGLIMVRSVLANELIPTMAISQDLAALSKALIVLPVGREYISSVLHSGEKIDLYSVSNENHLKQN